MTMRLMQEMQWNMIVEIATLFIKETQLSAFKTAFERAKLVVIDSPGCLSIKMLQGIENPSTFQVLIEWQTLEHHTVIFRESERFTQWRSLISPYFESPPQVEHFEAVSRV